MRQRHGSIPQTSSGFSLAELLVVVAILAVLAALLMPAIALAMAAAKSSVCANQLRELHVAVATYGDEWSGYLPEVKQCGAYPDNKVWWDIVLPYVPPKVGSCPALPKNYGWPLGYGMVHNLNGTGGKECPHAWAGSTAGTRYWCGWRLASSVGRQSVAMLIADSNNFHLGGPSNRAGYASWNVLRLEFTRHRRTAIPVLFVDGHVAAVERERFLDDAAPYYGL